MNVIMSEGQSTDIFWIIPPSSFMSSITIECKGEYDSMRVLFSHGNINLRGDCKDHQPQLDFLSAISSVVVVFLELETLHDKKAVQMLSVLHNHGPSGIILAIHGLCRTE
jgi:hypothetical protein